MFHLRYATENDLPAINLVIDAAIMAWNLPDRVKRLSLPSYHYNEVDLQHFEIVIIEQHTQILGLVAWEQADIKDTPAQQTGLLLHGIYVQPDFQHHGIGSILLQAAETAVRQQGLNGLLLKAQTDAIPFFSKKGFQPVEIKNKSRDYANRLWKTLNP